MKCWQPLPLAALISSLLVGCAGGGSQTTLPSGVSLIEQASAADGQMRIPYQKYQLDNGLTVILSPDDSDPLVHVDMTYHVGSAREELGKSGFAHFFEHMMFQGSEHVADDQHFQIVTESGGTLNGTTNTDRTNYFQTVPDNQLEKMLWLEADRMGFLLDAVTEQAFENQRATVKNERGQNVDNRPYGRMYERISQALYPQGHPYSWPVIGWPDDLNRGTVDDLRQFFLRWYGPNNATLTIGGRFDTEQTLAWVNQYFGPIPRGPEVENAPKQPAQLTADRYISMEDRVHLPLLYLSFPTVYATAADEAALDLLADILGGGRSSMLYQNLVQQGYAVQAGASHPCRELACEFSFYALLNPEKKLTLADLEVLIRKTMDEFETRGVKQTDLDKAKVQFEANTLFGLQSVKGKVGTLALNQTLFGQPDRTAIDLERYANVSAEDVMRVFNTYVKGKPSVIMSVVPKGQLSLIAAADNFIPAPLILPETDNAPTLSPPQIVDDFDRAQIPAAGANPQVTVPELWRATLSNGIAVIGTQSDETPTVELLISLEGGERLYGPEQAGLAALTAAMMAESTQHYSTSEFTEALDLLGSHISVHSGADRSFISVSALSRNLEPTMKLLEERLWRSAFDAEEFARVKERALQGIKNSHNDPKWVASNAFAGLLYGKNNTQGLPSSGTLETLEALTLTDVRDFYQRQFTAGNAQIVAVSDLKQRELLSALKPLQQWQGDATPLLPLQPMPKIGGAGLDGPVLYLLDKPNSPQSIIQVGKRTGPLDVTGPQFVAGLMNYPLGGAFNSRINMNLREDKGYTYGARSSFMAGKELGTFSVMTSVRSDVTAEALTEVINELKSYQREGMTEQELNFMRASISQAEALKFETPRQKASFLGKLQRYDLSEDYLQQQRQKIATISREELNASAAKELELSNMLILVVGDRAKHEASLRKLGYDVRIISL